MPPGTCSSIPSTTAVPNGNFFKLKVNEATRADVWDGLGKGCGRECILLHKDELHAIARM